MWPGSETMILQGVRSEIDKAITHFEAAKSEPESAAQHTRPQKRKSVVGNNIHDKEEPRADRGLFYLRWWGVGE